MALKTNLSNSSEILRILPQNSRKIRYFDLIFDSQCPKSQPFSHCVLFCNAQHNSFIIHPRLDYKTHIYIPSMTQVHALFLYFRQQSKMYSSQYGDTSKDTLLIKSLCARFFVLSDYLCILGPTRGRECKRPKYNEHSQILTFEQCRYNQNTILFMGRSLISRMWICQQNTKTTLRAQHFGLVIFHFVRQCTTPAKVEAETETETETNQN